MSTDAIISNILKILRFAKVDGGQRRILARCLSDAIEVLGGVKPPSEPSEPSEPPSCEACLRLKHADQLADPEYKMKISQ